MSRRFVTAMMLAALTLAVSAAHAQTPDPKAIEHFEKGIKLRDAGQSAEAIAEFTQSLAVEESIGAHLNLGNLLSPSDPAAAYKHYVATRLLAKARGDDRTRDADAGIAALLGSASHVLLSMTEEVARAPGLEVRVDGVLVPGDALREPVFTKRAGEHTLEFRANGREPNTVRVADRTLVAVVLGVARAAPPPVAPPPPPPPPPPPDTSWSSQKLLGAGIGAAGVMGLGIGAVVGAVTLAKDSEITRDQNAAAGDTAKLNRLSNDRRDLKDGPALISTIAFIAGGALLAGGAVLFFTAPSKKERAAHAPAPRGGFVTVAPYVTARGGGAGLLGRF